jgi:F-type H+-transporting ATPase subunit epsilon
MADPLLVELVSPERVIFSGEADMVITRTLGGGEIAFQSGHAPFLAALVENHTRIFLTDGRVQDVAVHGGFVEVSGTPTKVSILSDLAELAEEIDVERAKEALERHRAMLATEARESGMSEVMSEVMAAKARNAARLNATGTTFTA